jgi:hypothetical protein
MQSPTACSSTDHNAPLVEEVATPLVEEAFGARSSFGSPWWRHETNASLAASGTLKG